MAKSTSGEISFTIPSENNYTLVRFPLENDQQKEKLIEGSVWKVRLSEYLYDEQCNYVILQRIDGR